MQNTRSAFAVPRPSPSFPSLAVRSPASHRLQYARQLPVACSTLTASNGKLGKGLGKKLVARGVSASRAASRYIVICRFQASCFTNPQHYCTATKRAASRRYYTAKSYVLNQTWLGSDTDLFTFRYRCAVIRCNTTFWQLSDSKSKYMSDSKCNRMCNSSVD